MSGAALVYLAVCIAIFAAFVLVVVRTLSRKRRERLESPKFRMLDDDEPKRGRQ